MKNNDLNENFLGVFTSDKINKFIKIEKMMPGKKYSFIICNTDRREKKMEPIGGVFLIFYQKVNYFFSDSFWIDGMKHFIVQDDKKSIGKVLQGIELANRKDDKITLINFQWMGNTILQRMKLANS